MSIVIIKDRKVRAGLLFLLLILLPLALLFVTWLTNVWSFAHFLSRSGYPANDPDEDNYNPYVDIAQQLKHVKCPAREGLELTDYWECVWRTSITADGLRQHNQFLAEDIMEKSAEKTTNFFSSREKVAATGAHLRRRRAATNSSEFWERDKIYALTNDMKSGLDKPEVIHKCQHAISPGASIYDFVRCFLKNSDDKEFLEPTFQPTSIPPIQSGYDSLNLPLPKLIDSQGEEYNFSLDFSQLQNEEKVTSFEGADPYLVDHYSDYRYKYNNLDSRQRQPGWSYSGLYPPNRWHELNPRRFFVPLKANVELKDVVQLSDFAQTYSGIGDIVDKAGTVKSAMDYLWSKDEGYYAYTRFLVPLLDRKDLEYYKVKGFVEPSVRAKTDVDVLQGIIDGLDLFENKTSEILIENENSANPNPNFVNEDNIPYVDVYKTILQHFFQVDVSKYKKQLESSNETTALNWEYEIIRRFLLAYVDAVKVQENCIIQMVAGAERQQKIEEDLEELVKTAKGACRRENTTSHNLTMEYGLDEYAVTSLYNKYFKRKEARKRYTLPVYPKEFPICKLNEPSPLNIITHKGRQSTLRDYIFGPAAYQLNRFFMFFPLDASNLLTVGMVNGERLDGSSVRLTGGAVKGVNLTFQYINIRFASHWEGIGSEHWINGKGAQMELQIIFTIAGSADEVKYWHVLARVQNGLFQFREKLVIIISVLVDVLATDEDVKKKIEVDDLNQDPLVFEPWAQAAYHFHRVPEQNPENFEHPRGYVSKDPAFRLIDFIPSPTKGSKFYTYRGSLSWPPCFGYVLWSVFEQRLYMSKRQFDQFAKIPSFGISANNKAADNKRQLDDIRVEEEYSSFDFAHQNALLKARTVDRFVLEGFHQWHENTKEGHEEEHGVVGEEFYYVDTNGSTSVYLKQRHNVLYFLILFFIAPIIH